MIAQPRVYRLANGWGQTIMGLVLMVGFGSGALALWRFFEGGPHPEYFRYIPGCSLGLFACLGLALVVGGIQTIKDRTPKLTLGHDELIDHRAKGGELRIHWADVASVDCEISGATGKLVVYVRELTGVTTREVDISGLEQPANDVFVEIKKVLLTTFPDIPTAQDIAVHYDIGSEEIKAGQPDIPRTRSDHAE